MMRDSSNNTKACTHVCKGASGRFLIRIPTREHRGFDVLGLLAALAGRALLGRALSRSESIRHPLRSLLLGLDYLAEERLRQTL